MVIQFPCDLAYELDYLVGLCEEFAELSSIFFSRNDQASSDELSKTIDPKQNLGARRPPRAVAKIQSKRPLTHHCFLQL